MPPPHPPPSPSPFLFKLLDTDLSSDPDRAVLAADLSSDPGRAVLAAVLSSDPAAFARPPVTSDAARVVLVSSLTTHIFFLLTLPRLNIDIPGPPSKSILMELLTINGNCILHLQDMECSSTR
jgi:hypothetical protein